MNTKKFLSSALVGVLFTACLAGYSTAAASPGGGTPSSGTTPPQTSNESTLSCYAVDADGAAGSVVSCEEQLRPYEQFGLTYDAGKNELLYHGKAVRWFEDYYSIGDGQVGNDFFNENGVIDVYAVRDFTSFVRSEDGSFDPSGKLIGIKEFSAEEFAARDIEAIKNPPPSVALAGDPPSEKELEDMAKEYEAFSVAYDVKHDQWYFHGEKVRLFQDVLTSNGEGLTSGKFRGALRTSESADGTVDIYTVRDFSRPDASGNGTLIGVEKFSQEEFDKHTQANNEARNNSGMCVVE